MQGDARPLALSCSGTGLGDEEAEARAAGLVAWRSRGACSQQQQYGFSSKELGNLQYLMDEITSLPHITYLFVYVMNNGHSFGASSFHLLRLCTSIRRLLLTLRPQRGLQAQPVCPSGCICDQPSDWNTEELKLNCLKEVEITGLNGADHEVAFLKRLLNWAAVLENIRITLDYSISKSKARELCETLSNFCRPEIHMEFYMYQDEDRMSFCLLSPEDDGT